MEVIKTTKEAEDDFLREIKYSREQLTLDVEVLKDWLKGQKHLPETRMKEPDEFLMLYLVGAKGSLETVKRKLDSYYTLRSYIPIFQERANIELQKKAAEFQFVLFLPEVLPDGCTAMIYGARKADMNFYDSVNITRANFVFAEWWMRHCGIVRGHYVLSDAREFTSAHMVRMNPTILRSIIKFFQEALSARLKKYIVFNAPPYAESLVNNFVKPFLSEKMRDRIIVTRESIEKVFAHPEYLPKDYGGKFPSVDELSQQWEKTLMNWKYLPNLDEKVDDSLRTTKNGEIDACFGLYGSIKTLVID